MQKKKKKKKRFETRNQHGENCVLYFMDSNLFLSKA